MISYEGKNKRTLNVLKTIYFDYPEWTDCGVGLMPATWMKYRDELEAIVLAHPRIFPGYKKGSKDYDHVDHPLYKPGQHIDCWGTVWNNIEKGLDSIAIDYPLNDWADFDTYVPPDPMTDDWFSPREDWDTLKGKMEQARREGKIVGGSGLPHGFMFMRLYYLRGFENLMLDFATDDARLPKLIQMVETYNSAVIRKTLTLKPDMLGYGDDLGMQLSLPMSPEMWRKYIKPSYMRMFEPCRDADVPVALHTDGHILEIIPDLIEAGVKLLNPQIRANGLEGLIAMAKGKVALNQDLDRQLFPFASEAQIEDHFHTVYEGLHLPEGGLMLSAECEPDVSLEKIDKICSVLEQICNLPDPEV
ncbi:hypothetical protein JXJ21_02625 [candidate division KSB1 bacterium]|nr:hypothetical protein [candidate division KSB1 bacterium]